MSKEVLLRVQDLRVRLKATGALLFEGVDLELHAEQRLTLRAHVERGAGLVGGVHVENGRDLLDQGPVPRLVVPGLPATSPVPAESMRRHAAPPLRAHRPARRPRNIASAQVRVINCHVLCADSL